MVTDNVLNDIQEKGFSVISDFLTIADVKAIHGYFDQALEQGQFRQAGIGREQDKQVITSVRGDRILWIDEHTIPFDTLFYPKIQELTQALNRSFYLGLNDQEFHLALYPETTFYKKHRDAFRDTDARKISIVCYLNTDWKPGDGGELAIYTDAGTHAVQPLAGTVVIFESMLEHEVFTSHKPRYSLTGWLKRSDRIF